MKNLQENRESDYHVFCHPLSVGVLVALLTIAIMFYLDRTYVDWDIFKGGAGSLAAGLLVATLAFSGVLITNSSQDRRSRKERIQKSLHLRAQQGAEKERFELKLKSDEGIAREKMIADESMAIRKIHVESRIKAYTSTAQTITDAINFLGALARTSDADVVMAKPLTAISAMTAQIAVLGNIALAKEMMFLSSTFGIFYLDCVAMTNVARNLQERINRQDSVIDVGEKRVRDISAALDEIQDREGHINHNPHKPMLDAFEKAIEDVQKFKDAKIELQKEHNALQVDYTFKFSNLQTEVIIPRVATVLALLRSELGLTGDENDLFDSLVKSRAYALDEIKKRMSEANTQDSN